MSGDVKMKVDTACDLLIGKELCFRNICKKIGISHKDYCEQFLSNEQTQNILNIFTDKEKKSIIYYFIKGRGAK